MNTSKTYDLHLCFEAQYDEQPRIYARQLFLGSDGLWNTDDDDYDSYYFTQEDIDWVIKNFTLDEIYDYWVDEWFTTEDRHLVLNNLPPKAIEWVDSLPEYEYYTEIDIVKEII